MNKLKLYSKTFTALGLKKLMALAPLAITLVMATVLGTDACGAGSGEGSGCT